MRGPEGGFGHIDGQVCSAEKKEAPTKVGVPLPSSFYNHLGVLLQHPSDCFAIVRRHAISLRNRSSRTVTARLPNTALRAGFSCVCGGTDRLTGGHS